MRVFFNNCRCRDHVRLYGPTAFFDLLTTGKQAEMTPNVKAGDECVVATYHPDGGVTFSWYSLSHDSVQRDPEEAHSKVRVYFGKLLKSERLPKARAAKTEPYSVFFNVLGNFKRPSVIKVKAGRGR
jgi:hypothetical protein